MSLPQTLFRTICHSRPLSTKLSPTFFPVSSLSNPLQCLATTASIPNRIKIKQQDNNNRGTAVVLLNMGGPSTVSEVYDFLSRLFVRLSLCVVNLNLNLN